MNKLIQKLILGLTVLYSVQALASVEVSSFTVGEGGGSATAMITLKTTEVPPPSPIDPPITVYYWTVDGTGSDPAMAPDDYTMVSDSMDFTEFDTPQATVPIPIIQDALIEGPEDFSVVASLESPDTCDEGTDQKTQGDCAEIQSIQASSVYRVEDSHEGDGIIEDDDTKLTVNVSFTDGNPMEVPIEMLCNNGDLDYPNGALAATMMTSGGVAEFDLINFLPGNVCIANQQGGAPEGYVQSFTNCNPELTPSATSCDIVNTRLVHQDNNDSLGDAGIFQYYTVQSGWQTFIRVINTSENVVSIKVRFREAANSREVLDFIVFLSKHDMWTAWTDPDATGKGKPGIRSSDTSCTYPYLGNNLGEGWEYINGLDGVKGVDFQDRAFTDDLNPILGQYDDNAGLDSTVRMSEGHIEIIGIAQHNPDEGFGADVSHDHDEGVPFNCSAAAQSWKDGDYDAMGEGLDNVLAMNGYLVNVSTGQGGGFDPDILADFISDAGPDGSLWDEAQLTATDPDMDSATPGHHADQGAMKQKGLQVQFGAVPVTGGVDAVSYELQRSSVVSEWAASYNPYGIVLDYFTQWVITFPTKHYYVDLQDDNYVLDDVSPTLSDPNSSSGSNDAYKPFYEEFDQGEVFGVSCEDFRLRMWNREEASSAYLSPSPNIPVSLCYETNVIVFDQDYTDRGLDSKFAVTIPDGLFPVDPSQVGVTTAERGWASLDFYDDSSPLGTGIGLAIEQRRFIADRAGLPVTGFLFSIYNTDSQLTNHTTINAHKYRRNEGNTATLTLIKEVVNDHGGDAAIDDWILTANGPDSMSGTTGVSEELLLGTYMLSESGPAGYSAGDWNCVGGTQNGDQITLGFGDDVTCTIINDDNPAVLTLVKEVVGGPLGPEIWTLEATGQMENPNANPVSTISAVGGSPSLVDVEVKADDYELSETPGELNGNIYFEGAWDCVGGEMVDPSRIRLQLGEVATCTITNTWQEPPE